jgi:hypothetical protein
MTLLNWEHGKNRPRKPESLLRLRDAAATAGLDAERKLFAEALPTVREGIVDQSVDCPIPDVDDQALIVRLNSIAEWHDMYAHRLANCYLPEVAAAVRDALRPALETLKEIIQEQSRADGKLDTAFYSRLSLKLDELAARKIFHLDSTGLKRREHDSLPQ